MVVMASRHSKYITVVSSQQRRNLPVYLRPTQIRRKLVWRETCSKLYIIADAKTTVIIINTTVTHANKLDRGRETGTSE